MRQKTLDFLEGHQSFTPTKWREVAEWRRKNRSWLRYSQKIALFLITYMKQGNLTQNDIAKRIGCTQQYVSKILKGTENLTIETISKIEEATGKKIMSLDK